MNNEIDFEKISGVSNCPIIEAVIEVRFTTETDHEAVPHILGRCRVVKEQFGPPQNLPICELPSSLRAADPGLKYAPYQRREGIGGSKGVVLQIGPQVLSLVVSKPYPGKKAFLESACSVLWSVSSEEVISRVERLGVRYIDYFDFNVLPKLKFNLTIADLALSQESLSCKVMLPEYNGFKRTLQLATGVSLNNSAPVGSIFDVDAFTESVPSSFLQDAAELLSKGHSAQKVAFFSAVTPDFLRELNPIYER